MPAKYWLPNIIGVIQQQAENAGVPWLQRDDVLAGGEHHATDPYHTFPLDGLADDGECLHTDLAIGHDVIRPVDVEIIDLGARDELVDVDGVARFRLDSFEILFRDLNVALAGLVAFHDVVLVNDIAGHGVDLLEVNAVAALAIDQVETNFLGIRRGWKQQYGAGHE